jgi:hypothetical protein
MPGNKGSMTLLISENRHRRSPATPTPPPPQPPSKSGLKVGKTANEHIVGRLCTISLMILSAISIFSRCDIFAQTCRISSFLAQAIYA